MKELTHQDKPIISGRDQRPLIFSSKLVLALITTLSGWITFGLSEDRNVIFPENLQFLLYKASDRSELTSNSQVFEIDGYHFYKQPIHLSLSDKERLTSILEDRNI